jgi:hypothetical protein
MADRNTPAGFTFEEWRVEFNELAVDVGDIANLPATVDGNPVTDVIEAIAELNTAIGTTGIGLAADTGTSETLVISDTLTINGTANEIETVVSNPDTITVGLPDDVTITNDLNVGGNLDVTGNITLGGNITMGDADTDSIDFNADVVSNILPNAAATYDLGESGKEWRDIYFSGSIIDENGVSLTSPTASGTIATQGFSIAIGVALG